MFVLTIYNDGVKTEIHGEKEKLRSGNIVKGINSIDTLSFSMFPNNAGFDKVRDFTTLVTAYNTNKERYEFFGRVLYSDTSMDENGLITKEVTCESFFGYFCDSVQAYSEPQNWTVSGLLTHLINAHNSQVEEYKRFTIGEVNVTDPNDNLYLGIQRENTWDALKSKLLDVLGGEFRFRVENDLVYIDYLTEIGKTSETEIAISRNMKSIKQEKDPSSYVTRLIPLGTKIGDSETRIDITSVNDGKNYIDDVEGIALYGIHVAYQEWDDVTEAANLLTKGQAWLKENNKLHVKYSITALDLSLLGLDIDDFEIGNRHPVKNPLIKVDDFARIIKENVDIVDETKSTIEMGDNLKTLTDIQITQTNEIKRKFGDYVTFTGLENGTTVIDGGCIKAGSIIEAPAIRGGVVNISDNFIVDEHGNLTINGNINLSGGTITWGGNKPSSGISASTCRTIIGEELVSSPNIAGGVYWNLEQTTWFEIGKDANGYDNDIYGLSLFNKNTGNDAYFSVRRGDPGYMTISGPAEHDVLMVNGALEITYPQGTWDFSQADTTGIHAVFA